MGRAVRAGGLGGPLEVESSVVRCQFHGDELNCMLLRNLINVLVAP